MSLLDHLLGAADHVTPLPQPFSPLHFHFIIQHNSCAAVHSLFYHNDFLMHRSQKQHCSADGMAEDNALAVTSNPNHTCSLFHIEIPSKH